MHFVFSMHTIYFVIFFTFCNRHELNFTSNKKENVKKLLLNFVFLNNSIIEVKNSAMNTATINKIINETNFNLSNIEYINERILQNKPNDQNPCDNIADCYNCTMYASIDITCVWNFFKCEKRDKFV